MTLPKNKTKQKKDGQVTESDRPGFQSLVDNPFISSKTQVSIYGKKLIIITRISSCLSTVIVVIGKDDMLSTKSCSTLRARVHWDPANIRRSGRKIKRLLESPIYDFFQVTFFFSF